MSHKGPPPPPPPKGPPPPPKGKGPPPPPGGKGLPPPPGGKGPALAVAAPPVFALSNLPPAERNAWIKAKEGLNLNNLTIQFYPDKDFLLINGFNATKAKSNFSEDEASLKNTLQQRMQERLEALLHELFGLEDSLKLPVLRSIESKFNKWKPNFDKDGLNIAYTFLAQEAQKWRQTLFNKELEALSPHDPFYPVLQEKRKIADALHHQYADLYAVYQALEEGPEKEDKVQALQAIVQRLKKEQGKIQSLDERLKEIKETINKAETARLERIKAAADKITSLQTLNEKLKRDMNAPRFADDIKANEVEIKGLQDPPPEIAQRENAAIQKAHDALQVTELKQSRTQFLRSLFDPPASWKELSKKPAKVAVGKRQGRDTTGMVTAEESLAGLAFDIQFLPMRQIKNLALFFAENPREYVSFLENKEGLFALMAKINGITSINKEMNFNLLMDIAEGKIKRPIGYLVGTDLLKDTLQDESIKPNYAALLARSNRHQNVREEKSEGVDDPEKSFNKDDFEQYTQERGITITTYTPEGEKQKYYHYHRNIDLSYLDATQLLNLANFFAREHGEFLTAEGFADNTRLLPYINEVFEQSGLSFEEIVDIASGHMIRQPGKFADKNPRYATLDTTTKASAPNYATFIQQRKSYLEEQKRLAEEKKQAQRRRELLEKEQAREQKASLAAKRLEDLTQNYKRIYNISALNLEDEAEREPYLLYISGQLGKESDPIIKELIIEKLGLAALSPEPLSLSPSSASSTSSPGSSPRDVAPLSPAPPQGKQTVVEPLPAPPPAVTVLPGAKFEAARQELKKLAEELEAGPSLAKMPVAPTQKPKETTPLGLKKEGVAGLMRDNNPVAYQPLLAKNRQDEKGRIMEAFYQAISFLRAPDATDMKTLFASAHREKVFLSGQFADPPNQAELNELQELCIGLSFDKKLVYDDSRQYQDLLRAAFHKTTDVELKWLEKMKGMPNLRAFFDSVNEKTKENPFYKLMILKGYLYSLQGKYGAEKESFLKYKMGALCQHLLECIDTATLVNLNREQKPLVDALLTPEKCKAEYDKFLVDFNLNKAEDQKKLKGAKPARH